MPPLPVFNLSNGRKKGQEVGQGLSLGKAGRKPHWGGQLLPISFRLFPNYPPHPHHELRGAKDRSLMLHERIPGSPKASGIVGPSGLVTLEDHAEAKRSSQFFSQEIKAKETSLD